MTDNTQLDSTPDAEVVNTPQASESAKPETISETIARSLQELNPQEEKVDTDAEIPNPDQPQAEQPESDETAENETDQPQEQEETKDQEETELEQLTAPVHWPKDMADDFNSWTPQIQNTFMTRYRAMEADHTKKTQNIAKYRKRNEEIDKIFVPRQQQLELAGIDEVGAIKQLFAAQDVLVNNPLEGIKWLAKTYGVNLSEVINDPSIDDEPADPQVQQLQNQVSQLTAFIQNQQTQNQQSVQANTQQAIDQFAQEKDANGNIKHPHFDQVRNVMGTLIQNGNAKDMATAYEMAVYSDPSLRQGMMDQYAKSRNQNQVKKEAVKKAKVVTRSNVKGSTTPSDITLPGKMSIRETILQSMNQLKNGRS